MAINYATLDDLLSKNGIFMSDGDYWKDNGEGGVSRVSQGQIDELTAGLDSFQRQQLASQGYIPFAEGYGSVDGATLGGAGGNTFNTGADYMNYLYGGGQAVTGPDGQTFWQTPTGTSNLAPGSEYATLSVPTSDFGNFTKLMLAGIIGGGLTGMLPGTESVFGGAAAGAGEAGLADAAWGVNPAASEFSLAGGTAGTTGGGLSSAAGGVTGLTAGGAGVTGLTGTAGLGSGALLTPAMAASMGLPATAAMGGAGATAAEAMGGSIPWGVNAQSAASPLANLLSGNAGTQDYASLLGSLGAAGLGVAGSNAQGDAYKDVANQYLELGKPYRDMLLGTYQPGYSLTDSPDFKMALDTGAQAAARATSAQVGNPVGNPGAFGEMQKNIIGSLVLPQLNTQRSQLGTFGALGTNTAGAGSMAGANQTGGAYNALGYGLGQLTQPPNPFQGLLSGLGKNQFSF